MKEVNKASRKLPYTVLQADNSAHVVKDLPTGITAYISYKGYASGTTRVHAIDPETIVMERTREDGTVVMSVCTPDLGITDKAYTTPQASQSLARTVVLDGNWKLQQPHPQVEAQVQDGKTVLRVACLHGQPVEFSLAR